MSNYDNYIKYKKKYLKLKQLGSAVNNDTNLVNLGGKAYAFDTNYFFSRFGKIPAKIHGQMESLAMEDIDSLGFSNKYPEYFFEIKTYLKNDYPLADIYSLKIHKITPNLKYEFPNNIFYFTKNELEKYNLDKDGFVTNIKYKNIFENYSFKILNDFYTENYYVIQLEKK